MDFIVEQNHKLGYEIREAETAFEAWGYTEEEQKQKEREQIAKLSMTKREMFLGLYQAKQITPDILLQGKSVDRCYRWAIRVYRRTA